MKRTVGKSTSKGKARLRPSINASERQRMELELRAAEEHVALSALDALSTHLAILDAHGKILATNKAWRECACQKRMDRGAAGKDYFQHCSSLRNGAAALTKFAEGVQSVLRGERVDFAMEYPCQARGGEKWFYGKVTRFAGKGPVR